MQAYLVAGPAVEPVSLADAKAHLRLDGPDENDLVLGLVRAARVSVEAATRLRLVDQTWRVVLDSWPSDGVVALPLAPVRSVSALRIASPGGAPVGHAPALARLDSSGDPPRLRPDPALPAPGTAIGGIEIDLVCGFGAAPESVPEPLRLAIRLLVGRWFAARGDGDGASARPADVEALLAPFRRPRLVA